MFFCKQDVEMVGEQLVVKGAYYSSRSPLERDREIESYYLFLREEKDNRIVFSPPQSASLL